MQEKKEQISIFIERTDRLAHKHGCSLRELCPIIGISEATLFGCRGGKLGISLKTWSKLENAEKAVELHQRPTYPDSRSPDRVQYVTEEAGPYGSPARGPFVEERVAKLEQQFAEIMTALSDIRNHLPCELPNPGKLEKPQNEGTTNEHE